VLAECMLSSSNSLSHISQKTIRLGWLSSLPQSCFEDGLPAQPGQNHVAPFLLPIFREAKWKTEPARAAFGGSGLLAGS
jgi:hypothetical protein